MAGIISLTTDFGLTDEYVGVMKGVICGIAPHAQIIDLTHSIQAQNIRQAAFFIAAAYPFFPAGSLHVLIVDPGVGSSRRIILLCTENYMFLAPDNGLLTLVLKGELHKTVYTVDNEKLFLPRVSATFHGRDIFAPVAAHLIHDIKPEQVGPIIDMERLVNLNDLEAELIQKPHGIRGQVVHIDHFGNIITNITGKNLEELMAMNKSAGITISLNNQIVSGLYRSYAESATDSPFAVVGSRDLLEISVHKGNAAVLLNARIADKIVLSLQPDNLLFT